MELQPPNWRQYCQKQMGFKRTRQGLWMSGLTSAEHPMYTHRVVDDINFQVNSAFGRAGKIFIF